MAGIDGLRRPEARGTERVGKLGTRLLDTHGCRLHGLAERGVLRAQGSGAVSGRHLPSGHYIPEELPAETAQALRAFLQP